MQGSHVYNSQNMAPDHETRELAQILRDWSKKTPTYKQEKFRQRAKKVWERFRRLAELEQASVAASSQGNIPSMPPAVLEGANQNPQVGL